MLYQESVVFPVIWLKSISYPQKMAMNYLTTSTGLRYISCESSAFHDHDKNALKRIRYTYGSVRTHAHNVLSRVLYSWPTAFDKLQNLAHKREKVAHT